MMTIPVDVINGSEFPLPQYKTPQSAGVDVVAIEHAAILPGKTALMATGLKVSIPPGNEIQVRPRSGMALKHGVTVLNSPGTIDSDYRGDIGIILINHGDKPFFIVPGDRIAQLVLCPVNQIEWEVVHSLDDTERGEGGFGSTDDEDGKDTIE